MVERTFSSHGQEFACKSSIIISKRLENSNGEGPLPDPESLPPSPEKPSKTFQEQLQEKYKPNPNDCQQKTDTVLTELIKIIQKRKED